MFFDEELLLRIRVPHRHHEDVFHGDGLVESGFPPQAVQGQTGRNSYRHPAEHAAEGGFRCVEVTVSVHPNQPHGPGRGLTRVLKTAQHTHQGVAVSQKPHREESLVLIGSNEFCQMPVGQPHTVPLPVLPLFGVRQGHGLDGFQHEASFHQLRRDSPFLEVVWVTGQFGRIPPSVVGLFHQSDPEGAGVVEVSVRIGRGRTIVRWTVGLGRLGAPKRHTEDGQGKDCDDSCPDSHGCCLFERHWNAAALAQ